MQRFSNLIRLFFFLFVRMIILVMLGLNTRKRELLPKNGPAIVVANHNSHLDTLVLISLFPLRDLSNIRPVAAADYFLKNKFLARFACHVIGIIPISRGKANGDYDPLKPCCEALEQGKIIIFFPEGTRGEPERISRLKKGVAHLAERYQDVPVIPVFMHGLGKALPKGDFVLVPFFCDVFIGDPFTFKTAPDGVMTTLNERFQSLAEQGHFAAWE